MLYISTFSLRFTIKSYSCRITTFSFSHFLGKTCGSAVEAKTSAPRARCEALKFREFYASERSSLSTLKRKSRLF